MLLATAAVLGPAGPARAAASVEATPTTVWTNGQGVHLTWSGMTPRASVYIDQCDDVQAVKPQSFDYGSDCATLSERSVDGQTYNVTGSGATGVNGAVDSDFKTFVGPEPSGFLGWGCGPNGSPEGVKVGGLTMYNPCLLRVADSTPATPINVVYVKLTMGQPGAAPPAAIRLSPGSLTFPGTTTVGATSAPMSVEVVSAGGATPTIRAVGLSGVDPLDFHLGAGCTGATLAPGGPGCSVTLTFSPLKEGIRTAMLTWFDATPTDPPVVVTLSGRGAGGSSPHSVPGASATGPPGKPGPTTTAAGPVPGRDAPSSTAGALSAARAPKDGPAQGKGSPLRWVLTGLVLMAGIAAAIALGRRRSARRPEHGGRP